MLAVAAAPAVVVFPQTKGGVDVAQRAPPQLDDGWQTGSLESVGIDRERLEVMTASIRDNPGRNIHAVLIERNGRLVYRGVLRRPG